MHGEQVAGASDIIFLCVKPQDVASVLAALDPHVRPHHLVVSIAAGVTLATYERALPRGEGAVARLCQGVEPVVGRPHACSLLCSKGRCPFLG